MTIKIFGSLVTEIFLSAKLIERNILGANTSNFTASNQLFTDNPGVFFWRFEVVYTLMSDSSSSALNFEINQGPKPGLCSIHPSNGSTRTIFKISCSDWFDSDGINEFSFYGMCMHN